MTDAGATYIYFGISDLNPELGLGDEKEETTVAQELTTLNENIRTIMTSGIYEKSDETVEQDADLSDQEDDLEENP